MHIVLWTCLQDLGDSPAVKDMRASLEEERLATLDFLYCTVDNVRPSIPDHFVTEPVSKRQAARCSTCSASWQKQAEPRRGLITINNHCTGSRTDDDGCVQ